MPLGNATAIKLTTARYYTPSGRSIQAKGITPDIIVEEPGASPAARLREADLERHLENDREADAKKAPRARTAPPPVPTELPKPIELGSKEDFQLAQALNFLQGKQVQGQPSKAVADNKSGS
jgi:carboxyl-terminal processing protease